MPVDDWTSVAATDNLLVAEMLLKLKHSRHTWTPTPTATTMPMRSTKTAKTEKPVMVSYSTSGGMATFRWGRRKARSSHGVTRFGMDKKRATRSPTTPLSWSGGTGGTSASGSGNGDGYEASSMMRCRSPSSRSKSYVELKEEEGLLLKERQTLKRDLATLSVTLKDHRTTNNNLKRIKSMNVASKRMTGSYVVENPSAYAPMQSTNTSSSQGPPSPFTPNGSSNHIPPQSQSSISFYDIPAAKGRESFTLLPDLNMLPSIDEEPF